MAMAQEKSGQVEHVAQTPQANAAGKSAVAQSQRALKDAFAVGRDQEDMWKQNEITGYAVAFVLVAMKRAGSGIVYAGADDVEYETSGTGIAGSAITKLRNAHVIEDYWGTHADAGVFHGRRRSKKHSANGRKVGLYRLASHAVAVEFLRRHNVNIVSGQSDWVAAGALKI